MTTRAQCLAGVCPCSRPEYPGAGHECPPDPRSFEEREEDWYRQSYRPYENDEGISVAFPI
jgi:hypothetical protein